MPHFIKRSHISDLRRITQASFAIFCVFVGWRFYLFHQWAIGKSDIYIPRPPSVEAFLPISALMSLKKLILTGNFDSIHPAGLTIFMAAITISFLFRKGFCGWICPVGFLSHLIQSIATKIRSLFKPTYWLTVPWMIAKYLLLFFFVYIIGIKMSIQAIEGFIQAPYNITVDAEMLAFFLAPSRLVAIILTLLIVLSFVIKNVWCRFLCPYGALLGLFSLLSPVCVHRDTETCIDCKKCDTTCPGEIEISSKQKVTSPECIGCLECVAICPKNECMTVQVPTQKKISPFLLPLFIVVLFLLFWITALFTGHWHNSIPLEILQKYYLLGATTFHP